MKTILVIGAGKSSHVLVDYLLEQGFIKDYYLILADARVELAEKMLQSRENAEAIQMEVENQADRRLAIVRADVVVSMLPAFLHPLVARDCLALGKHFFSASYESEEMRALGNEVAEKGLFFLNECGLDPGIDHMSAMKIIDSEKAAGSSIVLFKSYCGGVLSPESENDNPWKYKFTWNPRNVVLAGQGVSRFIRNGKYKFVPYHMLFRRTDKVRFDDVGEFDGYANRDSLGYRGVYGLEDIPTIIRGTLRRAGFCKSWDVLVQLGMTDNTFTVELPEDFTMRTFFNAFLPFDPVQKVEEKLQTLLPWVDDEILCKLEWLGLFSNEPLPLLEGSPAAILQVILEKKWAMQENDHDMVVMQHQFESITVQEVKKHIHSSLVIKGENRTYTAMAKTVGLPLGIAVDMFLQGEIKLKGLHLPIKKEIYLPILNKLAERGIVFREEVWYAS
ncbi:saccharopine dehydrogenase NADP-binding domain-containing protein [Echinicola marina]|uniref:saccharopine dehydrogenase C-terminal domain-containing protein n=1 Tax=Echinicola marina TaxID=2859768 RepID=UPI001CF6ABDF|nr:saccharopine dehydrogenase C-terminal domain-containing protein [Echinicola marina]UCS95144.1 saccharopine dehydrogenase NADP-binding domain-containing protein [Echinicola marina]